MKHLVLALAALALLRPAAADGQTAPLPDMDAIARALGVSCEYCHVRGSAAESESASVAKAKLEVAKAMIAMTRDLNASVAAATGQTKGATEVQCVTCHRGVAIPRQLSDIVLRTTVEKGGDAAADTYRELRRRYYGRQSYDFGEDELLRVVQRLVDARPADAIALLTMNLEFHPESASSYVLMGQAYLRMRDRDAAIRSLEKALELDPTNAIARGRLAQLASDRR
jgi:tetratricopeptide (TPR) repeat protein